jgi:hypothetical protein
MMDDKKSSDGAAEIDSVDRKHSVKMANQASIIRNNVADRTYRNDHEAQRDDEETVSAAHSKMMAQRRRSTVLETKKQAKALRGHVFDDMYNHFGYQRVDPSVRSNTSLAHPGSGDMWFGDLDFSADAAALFEQSDPTPTPPNKQRSPLPMMCFGDLDFAADAAALFDNNNITITY